MVGTVRVPGAAASKLPESKLPSSAVTVWGSPSPSTMVIFCPAEAVNDGNV